MYNVFHMMTQREPGVFTCFNNHRNNNQTCTADDLEIFTETKLDFRQSNIKPFTLSQNVNINKRCFNSDNYNNVTTIEFKMGDISARQGRVCDVNRTD